uniref:Uncharacterized protein n=1 Tax=Arundo donax TaxID=35708 RepID=A0A0A9B4X2_ARUDO
MNRLEEYMRTPNLDS